MIGEALLALIFFIVIFAIDFIELNLNKKHNARPQQPNTPPAHTKSEAAHTPPKAAVNE